MDAYKLSQGENCSSCAIELECVRNMFSHCNKSVLFICMFLLVSLLKIFLIWPTPVVGPSYPQHNIKEMNNNTKISYFS
jgi:hypothetical protein